jgi:hypothetical protein
MRQERIGNRQDRMQVIPELIQLDFSRLDCRLQQMDRHIGQQQAPSFQRICGGAFHRCAGIVAKDLFFDHTMDFPSGLDDLGSL